MAGEKVWTTTRFGTEDTAFGTADLAAGPGTVLQMWGWLHYGISDETRSSWDWFGWVINVGVDPADATVSGEDPESVMLRGVGFAPPAPPAGAWTVPAPIRLESAGGRIMAADEFLWFRAERLDLTTVWSWMLDIRVLVQLPAV